jgi:RHS repeat-associated protein
MATLQVTYSDFKKIKTLNEGSKFYELTYGVDEERRESVYKINGIPQLTRYYLGDYEEEVTPDGNIRKIHYLSGGAILVSDHGQDSLLHGYADHQGSLIALTDESGNVLERYAYDPWGNRRNPSDWTQKDTRTSFLLNRGYTMHEHLDAFGIINMNGRVYDPLTAQFFSPDPYVQEPDNWLNYNRYSYCLNNPLKYTDPSGEIVWFIWAGAAIVGGVGNLISNWKNVDGFWDGLSTFAVGAGAACGMLATGGASAGVVMSVGAAGGAVVGANNNIVTQTGKNFSGFNRVDWGQVGISSAIGGVSGAASAGAGLGASKMKFLVNGVNNSVLRSAVVSPFAAAAGHVAGGTAANLFAGQDFGNAFANSFEGIGSSMAVGAAIGVSTTIAVSYINGVNPFNGKELNNTSVKLTDASTRPEGIPDNWIEKQSSKGGGTIYQDPNNPRNSLRVMPGNPNSPNPAQRNPYIKYQQNGIFYDKFGTPLPNGRTVSSHIPENMFDITKMPR